MRLHLRVLCEDQTGQQGGALLRRQRAQDVLEQQLGQQQLVAADLTSHAAFQLHRPAAVDVLEGLQHLKAERRANKTSECVCLRQMRLKHATLMMIYGTTSQDFVTQIKPLNFFQKLLS